MVADGRVLCLHGSGGSAASFFSSTLAPLRAASSWDFACLDAPHPGGKWWTYPAGERSYTAFTLTGADESVALVEAELIERPCVGLLGFSQGAMLAALVAQRCSLGLSDVRLRFAIMAGAATPKAYEVTQP